MCGNTTTPLANQSIVESRLMAPLLQMWALPSAIAFIVWLMATWYGEVIHEVPNPYLASIDTKEAFQY